MGNGKNPSPWSFATKARRGRVSKTRLPPRGEETGAGDAATTERGPPNDAARWASVPYRGVKGQKVAQKALFAKRTQRFVDKNMCRVSLRRKWLWVFMGVFSRWVRLAKNWVRLAPADRQLTADLP